MSHLVNTSHDDIVKDLSSCVFTNLIKDTFTKSYLSKQSCVDCGKPAEERCHGIGEERPVLLRRALQRVYPDVMEKIQLKVIVLAFLEEHIQTKFVFKCKACHKHDTLALKLSKLSLS